MEILIDFVEAYNNSIKQLVPVQTGNSFIAKN